MNDVSQFITNIGFPIFVAVWMLYKTSNDSKAMNDAINDLKIAITQLTDQIKNDNKGDEK